MDLVQKRHLREETDLAGIPGVFEALLDQDEMIQAILKHLKLARVETVVGFELVQDPSR